MEIILGTPDELLGNMGEMMLISVYLEVLLILTQDMCMVCNKHTIG
jgi:hypothetical protein